MAKLHTIPPENLLTQLSIDKVKETTQILHILPNVGKMSRKVLKGQPGTMQDKDGQQGQICFFIAPDT